MKAVKKYYTYGAWACTIRALKMYLCTRNLGFGSLVLGGHLEIAFNELNNVSEILVALTSIDCYGLFL